MPNFNSNILKNNPWVLPALIIMVLILTWFTRWDYLSEKSFDNGVTYKYKIDRWTGQTWSEKYRSNEYSEEPVIDKKIDKLDSEFKINQGQSENLAEEEYWQRRNLYTNIWYTSATAATAWLLLSVKKRKHGRN